MITSAPMLKTIFERNEHIYVLVIRGFLLRILLAAVTWVLGLGYDTLFFTQSDIFADSLKSGLAQRAVSASLLIDPRVKSWPLLFQSYLFDNPYLGPDLTIFHMPPLHTLQLMAVAGLIVLSSPLGAIGAELSLYCLGAFSVGKLTSALSNQPQQRTSWDLSLLLMLSYPAIVMLDRANYQSGFTSMALITYLLTAYAGKWRVIGMLSMVYAINMRPNTVIITLFEFTIVDNIWAALKPLLKMAVLTGLTAAAALILIHDIDPKYTLSNFVNSLTIYHKVYYEVGDWGLRWNDSLYGSIKGIRHLFGVAPSYSAFASYLVSALGLVMLSAFLRLAFTKRVNRVEAAYLSTAICVLFTPVYAEYHILAMVGPVVVLIYEANIRETRLNAVGFWPAWASLLLLCFCVWLIPSGFTAALLAVGAALVSLVLFRAARQFLGSKPTESLILTTSLLALCPLGGELSNGIAVSILLVTAGCLVLADCWKRPAQAEAINASRPVRVPSRICQQQL